jgi:hypothetical protein
VFALAVAFSFLAGRSCATKSSRHVSKLFF